MTKTVLTTNINEINGLKFVCKKCGAYFFLPLSDNAPPENCISCNGKFPWQIVKKSLMQLMVLKNIEQEFDFDILIETEIKE